ncbi:MAG: FAD-dependent oxidoreductase [Candidatus Neomarinimicrobiota bacterium]|nr:FAD-dependent oxidoreductase [Candidatus Neomarinimicrobiota bacterium]MDD3965636.1 FAD-dependent oxidoreductase [Candidatus Neomarinimicrobiota bacterium]MDX9779780.1 FAD-dependent oxidoreductase [bacterium]
MNFKPVDVIVVGAGLSGLTASALLAKKGLSVLLLEQHYQPGGSCGAFRREGATFDQGTAMFFGFGARGFNPHRFVMNELEEPIEIIKHDILYRLNYDGIPIPFYPELPRFFEALRQIFNEEEIAEIRAFYEYIGKLYHGVIAANPICVAPSEIAPKTGLQMLLRHPLKQLRLLTLLKKSAGDLMRRFVHSEKVIRFFNKLTSTYCYTLVDETPAILAVTMFMDNHYGGSYYPPGSSQQLPGKLEKAFERYGGEVLYETRAEEILFINGKVRGLRAQTPGGPRIFEAGNIIYAGNIWDLYGELIPEKESSLKKREWVKNLQATYPSVVLHCLVDAAVIPDGTLPIEMFADNPQAIDEKEITCYIFSLADPSICSKGTHTVMAIGPSLRSWPRPSDPGYRSEEYAAAKKAETNRMLDTLEAHFPGFRKGLRYHTLASPTSIERYTMKPKGCVAGPKQSMGQDLLNRPHASSEWENLFLCGESTVMGTGSPAVTISGISATNMLLRKMGMEEYQWHPGMRDHVIQISAQELAARGKIDGIRPNAPENEHARTLHRDAALCQWCENHPCCIACPYDIDIRGIVRRIEMGNLSGAYRELMDGRNGEPPCLHCPAPCEEVCAAKSDKLPEVPIYKLLMALRAD